jgi:2-C-methyl-D-erythritol 4-phosphate cytidylyltransferase
MVSKLSCLLIIFYFNTFKFLNILKLSKYTILVAGGSGSRMQSEIPKQFLLLNGKPILFHTIEKFYQIDSQMQIIVVLPQKDMDYWEEICQKYHFSIPIKVVEGGATRYQSVKNGLTWIASQTQEALVAIHDGVRPLVSNVVVLNSFEIASVKGSAIASVTLKDSIREVIEDKSKSVPRTAYRLIQTPQTFRFSEIWQAFQKVADSPEITDDASVYEKAGFEVTLIEGNYENIKITTPEDLKIAQAFLL